ncbi:MAG: hypothetical protein KatS3mg117_0216 [Geminicoccaceae bacterium]|nr:MAG: hypothetical protein KatS3mg117_0216 [Geminicoccaceae bacterium]
MRAMDEHERRRLRARNLAVAGALLLLVLLFYAMTIARIGSNLQ